MFSIESRSSFEEKDKMDLFVILAGNVFLFLFFCFCRMGMIGIRGEEGEREVDEGREVEGGGRERFYERRKTICRYNTVVLN